MYLARGFLNPVSRDVTRDLANPVTLHKTLLRAFPDELGPGPRARVGLLFRVDLGRDGGAILVLQSSVRPGLDKLPIGYFLDPSDDRLFSLGWSTNPLVETLDHSSAREGQRFAFRLRLLRGKKILDLEQHELVVVGLVGIATGRERQVVVVADDDVGSIDHVDVLDGDEREVEIAGAAVSLGPGEISRTRFGARDAPVKLW